jgi:adenine-specific DNA-methyltransferase
VTKYQQQFQKLLRELFQFDSADLDFGIYAILNQRRDQIAAFIDQRLPEILQAGLQLEAAEQRAAAQEKRAAARKQVTDSLGDDALDDHGNLTLAFQAMAGLPVVKNYFATKEEIEKSTLAEDTEAQIYNDLYRFFSRYYDDGDFVTKRRFGQDKYALPYNGQEVYLHWANADQYYIKSGEHFTDYSFTLPATTSDKTARVVFFKLQQAEVDRDNTKSDDKRFFTLHPDNPFTWNEEARTLTLNFEYRALTPAEKERVGSRNQQDKLNDEALTALNQRLPSPFLKAQLSQPDGDDATERPRFIRHLNRYTARHTRDFFIHKNLAPFLRQELDYFLKNEVLNIDDIDLDNPQRTRLALARVQVIRQVGHHIIAFLAQIENFQKKLFEKRKFIRQSDYCLTLDRIPESVREEVYQAILASPKQLQAWRELYALADAEPDLLNPNGDLTGITEAFLTAHPHLMLDTAFLPAAVKAKLLGAFDDLDEATDGLLVHGENFQALNLLLARYAGQVKCIYIDPPYNTDNDEFLYKDGFKESTWLCMIANSVTACANLLSENGLFFFQIGDDESGHSRVLLETLLPVRKNSVVVRRGVKNVQSQFETIDKLAVGHDIIHVCTKENTRLPHLRQALSETKPGKWDTFWRGTDRATMRYELFGQTPESGQWRWEPNRTKRAVNNYRHYLERESVRKSLDEWYVENLQAGVDLDFVRLNEEGVVQYYVPPQAARLVSDNWLDLSSSGTFTEFPHEKNLDLIKRVVGWSGGDEDVVIDYFAGSGTVGHAVMSLNQATGSNRKYILVEMGDYFDTVLKPRLMKVAYAADWKNGKPVPGSAGQSHMFRYIRLESYENALTNISFKDRQAHPNLFSQLDKMPDYRLHYMLDFETEESAALLNLAQFSRPFEYRLKDGPVDLVTTFNFLLGLRVETRREYRWDTGPVVCVVGTNRDERRVGVIWRNAPAPEQLDAERAWLEETVLAGLTLDTLYINGDSVLPTAQPLEPEFKRLMFASVSPAPVLGVQ